VAIREQLAAQRLGVASWRENIHGAAILGGFVVVPLLVMMPLVYLDPWLEPLIGNPGEWFDGGSFRNNFFATIMVIVLLVTVVGGPLWALPALIDWWWKRQYERTWQLLKHSGLALLVVSDAGLSRIEELQDRVPWLKVGATGEPLTLSQRIEYASDYWRAFFALARQQPERLRAALRWGNACRLLDDLTPLLFNGCTAMIFLAVSLPVMPLVLPAYVILLGLAIEQQAVQAALLDHFSEEGHQPIVDVPSDD